MADQEIEPGGGGGGGFSCAYPQEQSSVDES